MFGYGIDYCAMFPEDCGGNAPVRNPTYGGTYPTFPTVQANQGALVYPKSTPVTTLDKILASTLSGLALLTRQGSVPTAQQQYVQYPYGYSPMYTEYPAGYNRTASGSNALGSVEDWIKNNTLLAVAIGAMIVFYILPSPRQRRNGIGALLSVPNPKRRKKTRRGRRRR